MDRYEEKEKARKRRAHKFRIRERARQYARHVYGYNEREYSYYGRILFSGSYGETREEHIRSLVDREVQMSETRPRCSCTMCGNERSYFGTRTLQEKRFFDQMKDELKEWSGC